LSFVDGGCVILGIRVATPVPFSKSSWQFFRSQSFSAPFLPRTPSASSGVLFEEMPQSHEEFRGVSDATFVESFVNVGNDHSSNGFAAVRLLQQIIRQAGCSYFGDVFVLADRSNLVLVETAKANAIFQ
jgi:hypothetical protein